MTNSERFECDDCGDEHPGQPSAYVSPKGETVADRFCLNCWTARVKEREVSADE